MPVGFMLKVLATVARKVTVSPSNEGSLSEKRAVAAEPERQLAELDVVEGEVRGGHHVGGSDLGTLRRADAT